MPLNQSNAIQHDAYEQFSGSYEDQLRERITVAIKEIENGAEQFHLTVEHAKYLLKILTDSHPELFTNDGALSISDEVEEEFDLTGEVNAQIRMVQALRRQVMTTDNRISEDYSPRDAKEVLSASSTMLNNLMKFRKEIKREESLRAIEDATVSAISELGSDVKDQFFEHLKVGLEKIQQE